MNVFAKAALAVLAAGVCTPAVAQQIVETGTGRTLAGAQCSVTDAMSAAIEEARTKRAADIRSQLDAMLETALKTPPPRGPQTGESPVVFPPRHH